MEAEQRQLAELIGLGNYVKLVTTYGGTMVYIQKPDGYLRAARNDRIKAEFTGYNFRELAARYHLTDMQIRNIVAEEHQRIRRQPIDGQMGLF